MFKFEKRGKFEIYKTPGEIGKMIFNQNLIFLQKKSLQKYSHQT